MLGRNPARSIGVDIGASGIRAAELKYVPATDSYEVTKTASFELALVPEREGDEQHRTHTIKALRKLWRTGRFASRKVTIGVSDSSLITRQLDLPWMPPEDFGRALPFQIQDSLPVEVSTVEIDYHLLNQVQGRDALGQETPVNRILVVAASREAVTRECNIVRKAGLIPISADSAAFALIRASCQGVIPADPSIRVLVDIGAEQLTVIIHQAGQPQFIRTISNFGGRTATEEIARELDVTEQAAEQLKMATGLNGPIQTIAAVPESSVFRGLLAKDQSTEDPTSQRIMKVLNPWATTVIKEIRDSIDYFVSSQPNAKVGSIILGGRGSRLSGLIERIATELPHPVVELEAFAGLKTASKVSAVAPHDGADPDFTIAIGLAMGSHP